MKKRICRLPPFSRTGKIIRNFTAALALLSLLWALYDFPLPTREMVMRRAARQHLIQGPVHLQCRVVRDGRIWAAGVHGDRVLLFETLNNFLYTDAQVSSYRRREGGTLMFLSSEWFKDILPWVLAADAPEGSVSAHLTLHVRAEANVEVNPKGQSVTYDVKLAEAYHEKRGFLAFDEIYEAEGEHVGENAFCFVLEKHYPGDDTPEGYLENLLMDAVSASPEQGERRNNAVEWALEVVFYDETGQILSTASLAGPSEELPEDVWG